MPGRGKYRSIKRPRVYRALRRRGYSKAKSAKIANSNPKTMGLKRRGRRRRRRR